MGSDLYMLSKRVQEESQPGLLAACKRAREALIKAGPRKYKDLIAELDQAIANGSMF